jgi:hypothetical protein
MGVHATAPLLEDAAPLLEDEARTQLAPSPHSGAETPPPHATTVAQAAATVAESARRIGRKKGMDMMPTHQQLRGRTPVACPRAPHARNHAKSRGAVRAAPPVRGSPATALSAVPSGDTRARARYRARAPSVVSPTMPTSPSAAPPPLSDVLAMLVGRWRGEGHGEYPGVARFRYAEETTFAAPVGWALLHVLQQTWREPGGPSHLEVGLVIPQGDGRLLFNCAQDGGRTEVMLGTLAPSADGGLAIAWETRDVSNDPRIVRAGRTWRLDARAETLAYEAFVATHRTPAYRRHLAATLRRVA